MSDVILSSGYIVIGVIVNLLGKFLPKQILIPRRNKYELLDERSYVKYSRWLLYILGLYYIVLGIVLLFIKNEPNYIIYFKLILPYTIYIPLITIWKKYVRKLTMGTREI